MFNYNKGRFEVRFYEEYFDVTVTLTDILGYIELGSNEITRGIDTINIAKTGEETIVKVKVTSQSGLITENYTIAILEQSQNSNIDTITVNGILVNQNAEGIYHIEVANKTETLDIIATAEDTYAITIIDDIPNNSYIAETTDTVNKENSLYKYQIKVIAENGKESIYELQVEILEANYNLISVQVGEDEINLNDTILQEDGSY